MLQALADYRVVGVANNVEFLSRLTACPAFANADLDTGLIEREKDYLFPERPKPAARPGWRWPWPSCCASANGPPSRPPATRARLALAPARRLAPQHRRPPQPDLPPGDAQKLPSAWRAAATPSRSASMASPAGQRQPQPPRPLRAEFDGLRTTATVVVAGERRHVFGHGRPGSLPRSTRCTTRARAAAPRAACSPRCPAR